MKTARARLVAVACACVVAAIAVERVRALAAAPETDFDDAYMFVRYANNLLAGHGVAWNPGEPAQGTTGLAHLAVVAALRLARPAWSDACILQIASGAAALLGLALVALACARISPHPTLRGRPLVWAAISWPLVAYCEPFGFHAEHGMDTMSSFAANALLVVAVARLMDRPGRGAAALTALAGYAAWLARPDNGVYAFALPSLAMALVCAPPRRALWLGFAPLAIGLVGADLLARRLLLGTALPLALYAKRPHAYGGFVGEYTWNPFLFLEVFFRAAAPFVAVVIAFAGRRHARRLAVLLVPLALTFAGYFAVNQIMGHLGRFYFPSLPLVVAAAALVIDESSFAAPRRLALRAALALAVLAAGGPALEAAGARYQRRAETQPLASLGGYRVAARDPLPELDSWRSSIEIARLAAAAPPGATFAMTEHGLVGARAPRAVIVDLAGLHDRAFALGGFSARELWRRAPDFIWLPHWDYTQMIRDLIDSDELWAHYDLYPDVFTYGVALRRDGPRAAILRALLDQRFAAAYPGLRLDDYAARRGE